MVSNLFQTCIIPSSFERKNALLVHPVSLLAHKEFFTIVLLHVIPFEILKPATLRGLNPPMTYDSGSQPC